MPSSSSISSQGEMGLWLCIFIPSFIGTFTSLSVLYTLTKVPKLRKKSCFSLLFNASTADFLNNFVYYIPSYALSTTWCRIQGFFNVYLGLCTIFWPFCLMISMIVMIDMKATDIGWYPLYRWIGWGIPLFLALIPLFAKMYGDSYAFCFLKETPDNPEVGLYWRLWIFYIPLWLVIFLIIVMYFYVYNFVKEATGLDKRSRNNSSNSQRLTTITPRASRSANQHHTGSSAFELEQTREIGNPIDINIDLENIATTDSPKASVTGKVMEMLSPKRFIGSNDHNNNKNNRKNKKKHRERDNSRSSSNNNNYSNDDRNRSSEREDIDLENKISVLKAISRLRYYPLTLILSYSFATIRRLYTIKGSDAPYWLSILHSLFQNLPSILNPIIFYATPKAQREIRAYWNIEYNTWEKIWQLFTTCFVPNVEGEGSLTAKLQSSRHTTSSSSSTTSTSTSASHKLGKGNMNYNDSSNSSDEEIPEDEILEDVEDIEPESLEGESHQPGSLEGESCRQDQDEEQASNTI